MPILDPIDDNDTLAAKQAKTHDALKRICQQGFAQTFNTYTNGQRWVYRNPLGLTPEQVFAGMPEADALELKQFADLVYTLLNTVKPGSTVDISATPADTVQGSTAPDVTAPTA